jgi:hypothetical protein
VAIFRGVLRNIKPFKKNKKIWFICL